MKSNLTDKLMLVFKLSIIVFISRLALCFTGYIGMNTFPMYDTVRNKVKADSYIIGDNMSNSHPRRISINDFNKFDSGYYFEIADNGYPKINMSQNATPTRISFFPLYPLLIRLMRLLKFSNNNIVNSLILSNIMLIIALYYIYRICQKRGFKRNEAYLVPALILLYPFSIFYSVPYTESLFLCLSAGTIYYCLKNNYTAAAIFAGLSAVTRFPGFINIAYLFFMILADYDFKIKNVVMRKKFIIDAAIAVIPITLYFSYMKYLTGDFLAPLHDVANWGRKLSIPFKSYFTYISKPYFFSSGGWNNGLISFALSTAVIAVFIYYLLANYKNLSSHDWILFIYGFLIITVPFSSGGSDLVSIPRYIMVSIPMYFYIVELYRKREFLFSSYIYLFTALNALITIGYFNGYYFVV